LKDGREDGRIGESECDKEASSSGFRVVVLGEDDVHVGQRIPDEGTARDSWGGHGDDHSDQSGDKLLVRTHFKKTSI
jgi:hypothetical protein